MVDYSGMTVNERLFTAGLHSEFEAAIVARDRTRALVVLAQVGMTPEQAAFTVDATLDAKRD